MVRCEQFTYGVGDGVGYHLTKSSGVDQILSPFNLNFLKHQVGLSNGEAEKKTVFLPGDNIVAVLYLQPHEDEYGRSTVWRHVLLFHIKDYLSLQDPSRFNKYFKTEPKNYPYLKSLNVI